VKTKDAAVIEWKGKALTTEDRPSERATSVVIQRATETYRHEEFVERCIKEWSMWRSGEGLTMMHSKSMAWDEAAAAIREASRDAPKGPPVIFKEAEATNRALNELDAQMPGQGTALVHYHLVSSDAVSIAKRVQCRRASIVEMLHMAHSNFVALRWM